MKDLSRTDFMERMEAVANAQEIFIKSGVTNSIDLAWELYRDVLAVKDFQRLINSNNGKNYNENPFDKYPRPKCPECGNDLYFRFVMENPQGIVSQLVCAGDQCDTVLNSDMTKEQWLEALANEYK